MFPFLVGAYPLISPFCGMFPSLFNLRYSGVHQFTWINYTSALTWTVRLVWKSYHPFCLRFNYPYIPAKKTCFLFWLAQFIWFYHWQQHFEVFKSLTKVDQN
jgi:hypothetical protein